MCDTDVFQTLACSESAISAVSNPERSRNCARSGIRWPPPPISPEKPCRSRNSTARLMPRPSLKTGKRMPMGPALPPAAAASAFPSASGSSSVATSGGSGKSAPVARSTSAIESLLEGLSPHAPPRIEEGLSVAALGEVGVDDGVDRLRHRLGTETRADDGADGGVVLGVAAERDLVKLGAFLVDAQDADIAGMVMAAGVDAARHIEPERADQLLPRRIFEALGDLLGDGDRAGIGEIAIVEPRAADHVAQKVVIAGGETFGMEDVVERGHVRGGDMRQHQILRVVDARLVSAEALGEIGNEVHGI